MSRVQNNFCNEDYFSVFSDSIIYNLINNGSIFYNDRKSFSPNLQNHFMAFKS